MDRIKDLSIGEKAEITGYDKCNPHYREKLLSMGLTRGAVLTLVKIAPLGDPVDIKIRDYNLSLRKDEADILLIRRIK